MKYNPHGTDTVTVISKEGLKNAAHEKYGEIIVEGELAQEIAGMVRKAKTGNTAADIGMIIGLFITPLFIAGIGVKLLTKDLKCYNISTISETNIILSLNEKYR